MFSIEKLKVYDRALSSVASLAKIGASWDKRHALVDHLAHERLAAYRVSLEFMRWFDALPGARELSSRLFRQIDKAATSVVLNVAEGNGRCLEADRRKFVEIAESSAVKVATYLDLCERMAEVDFGEKQCGIALLDRVGMLLRGLSALS